MKMTTTKSNKIASSKESVHRFAHPFFSTEPILKRKKIAGVGSRMTDYIKSNLEPIPKAKGKSIINLKDVIGGSETKEIENHGSISFHFVGDTGHENGENQEAVSAAMSEDYSASHPEKSPALFVHLGDVIYYNNTDEGYHAQFYEPYKKYPGKIIAIPGNHDGELFKFNGQSTGQKKTLEAFQNNFCLSSPSIPPTRPRLQRGCLDVCVCNA